MNQHLIFNENIESYDLNNTYNIGIIRKYQIKREKRDKFRIFEKSFL